ncbi:hypothetical protein KDW82_08635 [Burkholderia vietnamiensis]|nr:hypothetical protein [Burkholderia vietnamiensis]
MKEGNNMSLGGWTLSVIIAMTAVIMGAFAESMWGPVAVGLAVVTLFILFAVRLPGEG